MPKILKALKSVYFIGIIQLIIVLYTIYNIKKLDILPTKLFIPIVILIIAIAALFFILSCKFSKGVKIKTIHKIRIVFGKVMIVLYCLMLIFVNYNVDYGDDFLDEITKVDKHVITVSVVVSNDSPIKTVEELDNKKIGVISQLDIENTNKLKEDLNNKGLNITYVDYDFVTLYQALYNNEVEAIIYIDSHKRFAEENYPTWENDIRIIHSIEIEEKVKDTTKEVDVSEESFNIFITGIDSFGSINEVSRSDVNMIVTVNPKTKEILLTSIPRDYYVEFPTYGEYDKLTHAGIFGVDESIATLENLFEIDINYYAKVNFSGIINIVDALGGITVNNPTAFTSSLGTLFQSGLINLNGLQTLEFVRERYNVAGGDNGRVLNQQRVIEALISRASTPSALANYQSLLNSVSGSFQTSLKSSDIKKLVKLQLDDMSGWNISSISVTGSEKYTTECYTMPGWELYVVEPNYLDVAQANEKINKVLKG